MYLQSDNENRIEIKHLEHSPKYLYLSGGGSNVSLYGTRLHLHKNQVDNKEYASKSNYNEEDLYCNKYNTRSKSVFPMYGYNSTLDEKRYTSSSASYKSILCSQHIRKENNFLSNVLDNNRIESRPSPNEHNFKRKYDIYATFTDNPEQITQQLHAREKLCSDKTTYCRPVIRPYNQEVLYKTMEKNNKLRRLVTELVMAREKEKEKENWNNYINHLREKHSEYADVKRETLSEYVTDSYRTPDPIEGIYNTMSTNQQSNHCKSLLQDFHKPHDIQPSYYNYYRSMNERDEASNGYCTFETNPLCFPTSAEGKRYLLETEKIKRLANRKHKPPFKIVDDQKNVDNLKTTARKILGTELNTARNNQSTITTLKCKSTQTEFPVTPYKSVHGAMTSGSNMNQDICEKFCTKKVRAKEIKPGNFYYADSSSRKSSLVCIEEKLDSLIHSINTFIIEIKSKNAEHSKKRVNYTRSDSCSLRKKEKTNDSSRYTKISSTENFNRIQTVGDNLTKVNDFIMEEIGKNNITLKRSSVREIYHPCSVQISVSIPTKEISTEVTRSLSKAGKLEDNDIVIEEIPRSEDRRIAIAVNTDPLSLLTMLRESTEETMKRLLSYVPTIDYYSYLSWLQGPGPKVVESHYVCNICGAAFKKPSALTDHIKHHDLGKTRDCCVCRHMLDVSRRRPSLFKCQYCGQRFTRAYCCELHETACAKRMGKLHDVTSSLVLLK